MNDRVEERVFDDDVHGIDAKGEVAEILTDTEVQKSLKHRQAGDGYD